ncbi:MAG: hypothetical protein WC340_17975 [Kiritimatiellia bacterium]
MLAHELFEEAERLKLRFVAGMERLLRKGVITEAQFDEIADIIDRLDDFSENELTQRLGGYLKLAQEWQQAQGGSETRHTD